MTNEALEVIKRFGKDVYKVGRYTTIAATLPFALPTYTRKLGEIGGINFDDDYPEHFMDCFVGGIIPTTIEISIIAGYYNDNIKWYFLTMLGTNIASGVYERFRTIRKQVREERANLENIVDNNPPNNPESPSNRVIRTDHIIDNQ